MSTETTALPPNTERRKKLLTAIVLTLIILLGAFLRFYRGCLVEVIRANCGVRKYRDQMRLDFQNAAGNEEEL